VRALRSLLAILAVGALSLTFTACGDDDGPGALGTGGDTSADDASGDAGDDSGDDVDLPSNDELEDLADMAGVDEACLGAIYVSAGIFGAFTDEASAKEAEQYFEEAKGNLPDDIRDDFEVVADGMKKYGEVLADHDYDFTKAMSDPDVQSALEDLDTPEFQAASDNVNAWLEENCNAAE
jgi:hypothetical protein